MFNATVRDNYENRTTLGPLPDASIIGRSGEEGEGPFMKIYLALEQEHIRQVTFETYGCPVAIACGSWVTRWLVGKTFEKANLLTSEGLMIVLGGLPLGKEHCATLAVQSLQNALSQWEQQRSSPVKSSNEEGALT